MLSFNRRRTARSDAGRAACAAALLAAFGWAAPASAFVAAPAWEDSVGSRHAAHGALHRHAPSGANVIGRGIGGLHGDLRGAAAVRAGALR